MEAREKRTAVRLSARMRSDEGWSDVQIRNVSPRGMLLHANAAPGAGGYVEVRPVAIVARIVWSDGATFGVRAQDRIDLKALIEASRARAAGANGEQPVERRAAPRAEVERSRRAGHLMQYAAIVTAAFTGAAAALGAVRAALAPLRLVEASLVGG